MILNTGSRTDIPAFYSEWFMNRIRKGYVYTRNPFYYHQVIRYDLSPDVVDVLVFCSKNPKPMLKHLDELKKFRQFWFVTITPYGKDIEPNVPNKNEVLDTFVALSKSVGKNSVSLRYDQILLVKNIQSNIPIIVVSARGSETEKVNALDLGADDYVTKPFNVAELLARIRDSLRKAMPEEKVEPIFESKGLKIYFDKYQAFINDEPLHFTPIEFKIIKLLIDNKGKVLTHKYIQNEVWGYDSEDEYQSLRVYMAGLRKKIEKDTANPEFIITEVGVGYRFVE